MKRYDAIIVGGATAGCFLARRLAENGNSVLVIDQKPQSMVATAYDIFHIGRPDFDKFGLPFPEKGDDWAFEYTGHANLSAYGKHPKMGSGTTVGMHMHKYVMRLTRWAEEAGAEFIYDAPFEDFLYDDKKTICGLSYKKDGKTISANASIVADCSGIPSVARRKLPDGYGVENFQIGPEEMFYVTLKYVKYSNPEDYIKNGRSWPFYKTWEAPQHDPHGAILGIGTNLSYAVGLGIWEKFEKAITLPQHEVSYTECGATPYRRPPYSFVADGFLVSGDAACLTKPSAGEGVTSAMVQLEIAAEVINGLLREKKPLTRENMWSINCRYIEAQGKNFAGQLSMLVGAVATNAAENDFFFEKDIIFSQKSFTAMGEGEALAFSAGEMIGMAVKMLGGIISKRLRFSTVKALLAAMKNSGKIEKLYSQYPNSPADFDEWCKRADELWQSCPTMADILRIEK